MMKKNNVLAMVCALLLGMATVTPLCAEERGDWSLILGEDVASSYLWRGFSYGGICSQTSAYFDYEQGDWAVSLGMWSTASLTKGVKLGDHYDEFDLSAEASWRGLTFSLVNYNEYYNRAYGGSYLDLGLSYTLSENVPLTLSWYSVVNQPDIPSYFELAYDFSISVIDFSAAVGALPFASGYYGSEAFSVCNLNLSVGHEFDFDRDGSVPVSAQVVYNPMAKEFFWGVNVGFYFSLDL